MQMKGHKEKDVVSNCWNARAKDLELIENGNSSHLILFLMLYLGKSIN